MSDFLEKIERLEKNEKKFLLSDEPFFILKKSFGIYKIDSQLSEKIAGEIGWMYVDDIRLRDLPNLIIKNIGLPNNIAYGISYELNKKIFNLFPEHFKDSEALLQEWARLKSPPVISEDEAWKKVLELEPWILELEKENEEEKREEEKKRKQNIIRTEKLIFAEAMRRYPETGEQLITPQKIELKNFPEPVRPSIKNWLADYTYLLGYEEHDAIERANYLFHTTNTRRLSEDDRERLAYILKAFDEKLPVDVDIERKQIVFPMKNPSPRHSSGYSPLQRESQRPSAPIKSSPQHSTKKIQSDPVEPMSTLSSSPQNFPSRKPAQEYQPFRVQNLPAKRGEMEPMISQNIANNPFKSAKDSNIQEAKFDFPQKMPFENHVARSTYPASEKPKQEKQEPELKPYRITSSSNRMYNDTASQPPVNPNNVIDLKSRNIEHET